MEFNKNCKKRKGKKKGCSDRVLITGKSEAEDEISEEGESVEIGG